MMETHQLFFLVGNIYLAAACVGPSNGGTFVCLLTGISFLALTVALRLVV